mgnify:CR=1 FL=1
MLITLYGINNIGKSTQAKKLVERLESEGKTVKYIKYPVYEIEPTGRFLNDFLRGGGSATEEELQMWFTLNRYQFEPTLKKWLEEGVIVIAEDYTGTGLAWGTTKGANLEWLDGLNKYLVREDLAILLDGERFKEAVEAGHVHETNEDFMRKSREVHLMLGEKYGWKKVTVVNGVDETAERVWDQVKFLV